METANTVCVLLDARVFQRDCLAKKALAFDRLISVSTKAGQVPFVVAVGCGVLQMPERDREYLIDTVISRVIL
jgi:hypothetical protein